MKGAAASFRASYRGWLARPRPLFVVSRSRTLLWRLTDRWRRSLQLRVLTATLVLCGVVVAVLGYFLMQQLVADVYANKAQSAENIANVGLATAKANGELSRRPNGSSQQAMLSLARELEPSGGTPYAVEVTLPRMMQGPEVYGAGAVTTTNGGPPPVPADLVSHVSNGQPGDLFKVWAELPAKPGGKPVPELVFGARFGKVYQLYYFFPLSAEQQSIASMQRTLLLVGVALVFLLAAIAWLVTRWVVIPVRLAAQGAWRLSTGKLNERMDVRGNDELAALATSFNEMAASLQEKLEELEDLSQVQRQFVSDVSHELRTPLTTIRIASDVLFAAREEMDQAAARSAELMQGQLERFESLLTDLLEISRYDANAATLDAEPVDVCTIVRQSADVAQQLAERRGCRLQFRLPAEPCIAEVDRRRVERILRNLLLNAVEHGEGHDTVVTAAMDSAAVAISVRDFGVGLAPGEDQLVFDRFWRADPARARSSGGTGLGLAIALEDARLHGGWLEAWGEQGRGSMFRLTLPRTAGGGLHGSPLPLNPDLATDISEPDVAAAEASPDLASADPAAAEASGAVTKGDVTKEAAGGAAENVVARGGQPDDEVAARG
ncbi:MAG TPA: MtrAB system histidine kinase MtrB [Streptosporangiaceae bacterium]|nr:MtrAB system histidine kinase MtrB [Streptosporangiaceae bacterium]